jgi:hypothetical protein
MGLTLGLIPFPWPNSRESFAAYLNEPKPTSILMSVRRRGRITRGRVWRSSRPGRRRSASLRLRRCHRRGYRPGFGIWRQWPGRWSRGPLGVLDWSRPRGRQRHFDRTKWFTRLADGLASFSHLGFLHSSLRPQFPEMSGVLPLAHLLGLAERLQFNAINFRQGDKRRPIRDLGEWRRIVCRALRGSGLLEQGPRRTDSGVFAPN